MKAIIEKNKELGEIVTSTVYVAQSTYRDYAKFVRNHESFTYSEDGDMIHVTLNDFFSDEDYKGLHVKLKKNIKNALSEGAEILYITFRKDERSDFIKTLKAGDVYEHTASKTFHPYGRDEMVFFQHDSYTTIFKNPEDAAKSYFDGEDVPCAHTGDIYPSDFGMEDEETFEDPLIEFDEGFEPFIEKIQVSKEVLKIFEIADRPILVLDANEEDREPVKLAVQIFENIDKNTLEKMKKALEPEHVSEFEDVSKRIEESLKKLDEVVIFWDKEKEEAKVKVKVKIEVKTKKDETRVETLEIEPHKIMSIEDLICRQFEWRIDVADYKILEIKEY